jgi:hypothetical protein
MLVVGKVRTDWALMEQKPTCRRKMDQKESNSNHTLLHRTPLLHKAFLQRGLQQLSKSPESQAAVLLLLAAHGQQRPQDSNFQHQLCEFQLCTPLPSPQAPSAQEFHQHHLEPRMEEEVLEVSELHGHGMAEGA